MHYKDTKELALQALQLKRKGMSLANLRTLFKKSRITIWRWLALALALENSERTV